MERNLRKQQSLLMDAGIGVILFSVWSIARVNLYLGLSPVFLEELHEIAKESEISETAFIAILWLLVTVGLMVGLIMHLYVGLSAIAEGKGEKRGYLYLVVASVLLVATLRNGWEAFGPEALAAVEGIDLSLILGFSLELASVYVILELLITGIRVKRLKKMLKG